MANQLDPSVVNLAKAIRQQESGGDFTVKGKSGEYGGYQFTPDTWNAVAPKYGINTSLDQATPEQQNAVAYNRIKAWKDSGKNVTQIASMWNAGEGEPDAYTGKFSNGNPSIGTNNFGAQYNVPAYAKAVSNYYLGYKNGSSQTQTPSSDASTPDQQPESFGQKALNFLGTITGTKGAGEDIGAAIATPEALKDYQTVLTSWSSIADKLSQKIQSMKTSGEDTSKMEAVLSRHMASMPKPSDFLPDATEKTDEQLIGDFGQLALGVVAGGEVPGVASDISGATSVGSKILEGAKVGATFGGIQGGLSGLQNNEGAGQVGLNAVEGIGTGALLGGGTAGLLAGAGKAIGAIGDAFTQKTESEIQAMASNPATTDKEIANLSPTERVRFNELKTDQINDAATQAKSTRDAIIQTETQRVTEKDAALKEKLDTTKNTQAMSLKPLAVQSLKDNSDLFMEKVDSGFSEGTNLKTKISAVELEDAVNQITDPTQKALAKQQFGLDKLITTNPDTGTITYKNTTLGDVWRNSKDLRQTIGSGAKTGGRVFTADEMATVQNTKVLTDLLEKHGMDLTEANEFWTKWTKMRKQILTQVKPFDTEGAAKMPIESTIERASTPTAKGYTHAKNFITQLENETGLPPGTITADTEKILSQIDKNKLDQANIPKLSRQISDQIKADKEIANRSLDSQQFSVQQIVDKKARTNRIILTVLKAAGLVGLGYEGVKHVL